MSKNLINDGSALSILVARYSIDDLKKHGANKLLDIVNYSGGRSGLVYSIVMDNNGNIIAQNINNYYHDEHIASQAVSSINPLRQTYIDTRTNYTIHEFSRPLFNNGKKDGVVRIGFSPDINPLFTDSDIRGMLLIATLFFSVVPIFYYLVRSFLRLHILSITDELTGLYNRRGFFKLAEDCLSSAKRMGKKLMLLYADLDNMKQINDVYGHEEGDRMLQEVSSILKATYRTSDIIARIGGDEFVVFPVGSSEDHVDMIINRLNEKIDQYNKKNKSSYKLEMSVGIATYDPHAVKSINELLNLADSKMYEDKNRKKNKLRSDETDMKGHAFPA
jgi:diguanylate cyclase (GGDEF)-like protein